jgi:hypothetical protein
LIPTHPAAPFGKAKREILETVKEVARAQGKQLQELAIIVAASKTRTQVIELTAIKGFSYEDMLQSAVASIASVHGDIAEQVGRTSGLSGTQKGDHLVTINAEDTCGEETRFVIECKDRRLSMSKTMDELGKAMDNHGAQAAIAVFSRDQHAPPRSRSPGRATGRCWSTTRRTQTATPSSSPIPGLGGSAVATSRPTGRQSMPGVSRPLSPEPGRHWPGSKPLAAASP